MSIKGNNGFNMMQMMSSFRNGDPRTMVTNMVKEAASQGNPIMQNLASLIEKGDTNQIESVVKNIAKERGIDFDKEFSNFKKMFKL